MTLRRRGVKGVLRDGSQAGRGTRPAWRALLAVAVVVVLVGAGIGAYLANAPAKTPTAAPRLATPVLPSLSAPSGTPAKRAKPHKIKHHTTVVPAGVTLRQIDGGPTYYANISPGSSWMDQHILLGGWLEQPLNATEVGYDAAMGNNIYWNLAGSPNDSSNPRADYNVLRAGGMHASAPDTTAHTGSETVSYDGDDEDDMNLGAGSGSYDATKFTCVTSAPCGYTASRLAYTGSMANVTRRVPQPYPSAGAGKRAVHQGDGKGVLFWESAAQAAKFLRYSDTVSADSYWMTDPDLEVASQGGCALFPHTASCRAGNGQNLTAAQSHLPVNYEFDVKAPEALDQMNQVSKPVVVDIETGCPFSTNDNCITPAETSAAAMHAIIAGARGIIWFQHNFGGPCHDDRVFVDGSNPASGMYHCHQTPGVTLHDVVVNVTAFNAEINSLNSVLLAPFARGYVSVAGTATAMAKYDGASFYIFAGSGEIGTPPPDNQAVTFKIKNTGATSVTVVGEHRTIPVTRGGTTFSDTFASADSYHVYKIN